MILFTESSGNHGTNISKSAEFLYPQQVVKYLPGWFDLAEEVMCIKHYPAEGRGSDEQRYAIVTFNSWKSQTTRAIMVSKQSAIRVVHSVLVVRHSSNAGGKGSAEGTEIVPIC